MKNRDRLIISLVDEGLSNKEILEYKVGGELLCKTSSGNLLSERGLQKIIQTNREYLSDNFSLKLYKEVGMDFKNYDLKNLEQEIKNRSLADFIKFCGYDTEQTITKRRNEKRFFQEGVLYLVKYSYKDYHVIKYGITSPINKDSRYYATLKALKRYSIFKEDIQNCWKQAILKEYYTKSYQEVSDFEKIIKKHFYNNTTRKEIFPDGYTETLPYSEDLYEKLTNFIEKDLFKGDYFVKP